MFGSGFVLRASAVVQFVRDVGPCVWVEVRTWTPAVVQSVRDVGCLGQGLYFGHMLGFSL